MDGSFFSTPKTRNGSGKRSDQRSDKRVLGESMSGSNDPFALEEKLPTRISERNGTSNMLSCCSLIFIILENVCSL